MNIVPFITMMWQPKTASILQAQQTGSRINTGFPLFLPYSNSSKKRCDCSISATFSFVFVFILYEFLSLLGVSMQFSTIIVPHSSLFLCNHYKSISIIGNFFINSSLREIARPSILAHILSFSTKVSRSVLSIFNKEIGSLITNNLPILS